VKEREIEDQERNLALSREREAEVIRRQKEQ
jgi:hypothetical protein